MKRGASTFPFLLVFIMIAGAIILLFFITFGKDIFSFSDKLSKGTIIKNLDQQLAAFSLPENSGNNLIDLGKESKISMECRPYSQNNIFAANISFLNKNNNIESTLKSQKLILAPDILQGKFLKVWTLSWNYPFKIDNLYFFTDERVIFYFVQDPNFNQGEQEFYDNFPQNMNKVPYSNTQTFSIKDKKILVLIDDINTNINPYKSRLSNKYNIVLIDKTNNKVKICEPSRCKEWLSLGNTLDYAAIFSKSIEEYDCIRNYAINQRLSFISEIYNEKITKLQAKAPVNCDYSQFSRDLNLFKNNPTQALQELLINQNRALELDKCPGVF